jgi:hypothetical protein
VISPVTKEERQKRPEMKLFQITENKKRNKWLMAGAGLGMAAAIIGGILDHTSTEDTPGEAMRPTSSLKHHILEYPLPNIRLYKSMPVRA